MTDPDPRPITFDEAERIDPYHLARMWGDRDQWPMAGFPRPREAGKTSDLEELAMMAALQKWMERWTPHQINSALLAGATVEQCADAVGVTPEEVVEIWQEWSDGQRQLAQAMPAMVSADRMAEFDRVAKILERQNH